MPDKTDDIDEAYSLPELLETARIYAESADTGTVDGIHNLQQSILHLIEYVERSRNEKPVN